MTEQLHRSAESSYATLPCPFCGQKPQAAANSQGGAVYCDSPDCFGPRTTAQYLTDAVAQWNKRTPAGTADDYERRIREKVFASKILTDGEWVYLVGLFHMAREVDEIQSPDAAQPEQQAALAWHCCDERYPWIQGIVTTSEITLDAWRDSGIKYQPLYPLAAQPPAAPVDLDSLVAQITPENRHPEIGLESSSAVSEPAAWQWRYVGETEWKTPSGGRKITDEELKRERPIEQRPLYAGKPQGARKP